MFEDRVRELRETADGYSYFQRGYWHEDGSFTAILSDPEPQYADPRQNDGNVAKLVMQHRDYLPLDDSYGPIEDARDRWGEGETVTINAGRFRVDSDHLARRYLAMFHPEVLAYEPRWQVHGSSQSDWAYGYAYVLREGWDAAFPGEDPATGYSYTHHSTGEQVTITPATCIEQEVAVYGQYFAGEVYGYVHVEPGAEEITADFTGETARCRYCQRGIELEDGDWIDPEATGDDSIWRATCQENDTERAAPHEPTRSIKSEDSCWGFLGYDSLREIAAEATGSPVTEEVWS